MIEELFRKIRKYHQERYYVKVLSFILQRKTVYFKELLEIDGVFGIRSIILNLVKHEAVARHKTSQGTLYIATSKTQKLLDMLIEWSKKYYKIDEHKILKFTLKDWCLNVIADLKREGIKSFNKSLFFKKLYEIIEEYEKEGYHFQRPKLVSIDRVLRQLVSEGVLEREGTKRRPYYIIKESFDRMVV